MDAHLEDFDQDLDPLDEDLDRPEWMREEARRAQEVEAGMGTRYLSVPHADSRESYRDMEAFIATVVDARLGDRLDRAIQGRGAFGRFKDVLAGWPAERERWFQFHDARLRERVLDWLRSEDIEAIVEPAVVRNDPDLPAVRVRLIAEVLAFVQEAKRLAGVRRIALIGSLTTAKVDPKDADVLVTVTAEADLAPLAKLGRRLQGRAQSFNRGGDIFLADPEGKYLGRTCAWKECRPGIRQSCDALHCGRRAFLHDDLRSIKLEKALVSCPPVELWPQVITRITVPQDVEEGLLQVLRG